MPTIDINLNNVQDTLVSGTNIKTINGESVLGSGDLDVSQDISGIATNASAITTIQGEQTTQDAAIALNTAKNSYPSADATKLAGIEAGAEVNDNAVEIKTKYESNADTNAFTDAEKSNLANQSGTNTGDQDISGIATNASAITTIQGEQTTQDAAIALNTAKNSYPSADATKLAGIESGAEVNTVDSVNGELGVVVLDTDDINEGTINEYYTDARVSANADVVANTAKNSYPLADATKLAGIETGAEVNDTAAEIKTKYESNADTNAFTDAEKTNLGNQSGTNTGDQDLSGLQETLVSGTNIKTINGESVLGVGNITIASLSVGTSGQIPYTNAAGDDLAYSSNFTWDAANNRLGIGTTSPSARLQVKGSGTTSATTSFLVQNSAGTNLLKVTDSGVATFYSELVTLQSSTGSTLELRNTTSSQSTNALIGAIDFYNKDADIGNFGGVSSYIRSYSASYFGSGGYLTFGTLSEKNAGNTLSERMRINEDGNVGIGTTSPTARLQVKGSGTTSATTTFLLQNSAGTNLLKVTDDSAVTFGITSKDAEINYTSNAIGVARRLLLRPNADTAQLELRPKTGSNIPAIVLRDDTSGSTNSNALVLGRGSFSLNNNVFHLASSVQGVVKADSFPIAFSVSNAIKGRFEALRVANSGNIGINITAPTALIDIAASTTDRASLRIRDGVAPTTPNDGDIWSDGSDLKVRLSGVTYTLNKT